MRRGRISVFSLALLGLGAIPTVVPAADDQPPRTTFQVLIPPLPDFEAAGLNARGDLVGYHWVDDPEFPNVVVQRPVVVHAGQVTPIPLLEGYTTTQPAAISDDLHVVGRAGKPSPPGVPVEMRSQAFVWNPDQGIHGLGTLPGDLLSYATAISQDGRLVGGMSLDPSGQPRACLWRRDDDGSWKIESLPEARPISSPFLAVSPNGRHVASTVGTDAVLWTDSGSGEWSRRVVATDGQLAPRAVNNQGTIAGVRHTPDGFTHAMFWSDEKGLVELEKPPGYARSEARGINSAGTIVGFIDGPHGSPIGPYPAVWENSKIRIIIEGGRAFALATAINDANQIAGVNEVEPQKPDANQPDADPAAPTESLTQPAEPTQPATP